MATVTRGKQFETEIHEACNRIDGVSIDRLIDPQAGYAGVRNICDFIAYKYPTQFYLECKSCHGNTLSFSNITENQWNGLLEKSKIKGVISGYMVWFIDKDVTVFVPATQMKELKDSGAKSLNIKDITESKIDFVLIAGQKRRIMFNYDLRPFFTYFTI